MGAENTINYGEKVTVAPGTGLGTAGAGTVPGGEGEVEGRTGKNGTQESKIAEHSPFKFAGTERIEPTGGPADAVRTGAVPAIREAVYKEAVNVNNAPVLPLQSAPGLAAGEHGKVEAQAFHKPPTSNLMPFNTTNADIRGKATIGKGAVAVSDATERSDEKKGGEEDKVEDVASFDASLKREEA
jgi:hypothetical protein